MNQLNVNHKLILFPLLLFLIGGIADLFDFPSAEYRLFIWLGYLLPNVDSIFLPNLLIPLLGLLILLLTISNEVKRAAIGFIPILIYYFSYIPWWVFDGMKMLFVDPSKYGIPLDFLYFALGYLICFGLLLYGTFPLIKEALDPTKEIVENPKSTNGDSTELSDKEFLPTILLCFFVGIIGVHRFYVGKLATGVAMILTLGGLGIWVLVDFIMICVGSFRDIEGRIIKYQRTVVVNSERSVAQELEKFAELKEKGVISEEEFNKKKEELL